MRSIARTLTSSSRCWGLGLLVSMLAACGEVTPPAAVEDGAELAVAEQELDGECTADWSANPCTVADSAACGTGSPGVDSPNTPNNCEDMI